MEFRKSVYSDITGIMNIIDQAKVYFKESGIDQWQNGYPNSDTIKNDILNNNSYVLLMCDVVIGTAAVSFDGENTYNSIYNGDWLSKNEYAVIHRIAVDPGYKGQGMATHIIRYTEAICLNRGVHSIKIYTHRENASMQRLLEKNNFQYCGIIYLADKNERLAYEKLL